LNQNKVIILHQEITPGAAPDEQDVLLQAQSIARVLGQLGYHPVLLPLSLDLANAQKKILSINPLFIFNLVESVHSDGRLIHLAPALLDHLKIPYTGNSTEALFQTSHKLLAKRLMHQVDIATPAWITMEEGELLPKERYIIKAVWEHASIGLGADSVLKPAGICDLRSRINSQTQAWGTLFFAERYIEGREFCVPLLNGKVLPISEIRFQKQLPIQILSYQAKWNESSSEYKNSIPHYEHATGDSSLITKLEEIAASCWNIFQLRGAARVDFRVDENGKPWVLEVNANPCMTPGSGFYRAATLNNADFLETVSQLIPYFNFPDKRGICSV